MQFYGLDEYLEPVPDEQDTDGRDESNSHDPNDWKARRPCKYIVNYGSCRKGIDCEFSHEKDDSSSWHNAEDNGPQARGQDDSPASGNKDAEENTSAQDWNAENQNDRSLSDGDGGNRESNKSTDNWWNDNGGQASTDQWDKIELGSDNDQRDSSGWDATAEGNSEMSRKSQRPSDGRRTVCRYYARGSCHRLDCRFAHETDDTALHNWNKDDWVTRNPLPSKDEWGNETKDTVTRPDQGVCWAFLRGACYRTTCRFAHESASNQLDGDNESRDNQAISSQNRSADAWDPQPSESNIDSWHQTDYISPYASSGRPREACLYFGQGYCQKGDSCPLLHIQSDEILSENQESENQEVSVSIFH